MTGGAGRAPGPKLAARTPTARRPAPLAPQAARPIAQPAAPLAAPRFDFAALRLRHDQPVQLHASRISALSGPAARDTAIAGVQTGAQPLPHRERIQRAFGPAYNLTGVSAHVGGAAATASVRLGADGYTVGDRVAFRTAPDLRLAAHEAAHVVQQRAGVQLKDNLGRPGDSYERQADAVADAVVAGRSAAGLLGPPPGRPASAAAVQLQAAPVPGEAALDREIAKLYEHIVRDQMRDNEPYLMSATPADVRRFLEETGRRLPATDYVGGAPRTDRDYARDFEAAFRAWYRTRTGGRVATRLDEKLAATVRFIEGSTPSARTTYYVGEVVHASLEWSDDPRTIYWMKQIPSLRRYTRFELVDGRGRRTQFLAESPLDIRLNVPPGPILVYCTFGVTDEDRRPLEGDANQVTFGPEHPLLVVDKAQFAREAREGVTRPDAEGNLPQFERDARGQIMPRPGAAPDSIDQRVTLNNLRLGAFQRAAKTGEISPAQLEQARDIYDQRNAGLRSTALPSSKLYVVSGVFVGEDSAIAIPVRVAMANNLPGRGDKLRVVAYDLTLDPKAPIRYEGAADKPNGTVESGSPDRAAWREAERQAIQQLIENWKATNDYPPGTVTLYIASQLDRGGLITATIPQNNWKKTLRQVLAPVSMIAGIAAMVVGQPEIAIPLIILANASNLAMILLGIEDRIKKGRFGFDKELLFDALQLVSMAMGFGTATSGFRGLAFGSKLLYLATIAGSDIVQGIMIGAAAKEEIDKAREDYERDLKLATSDDERRTLLHRYQDRVARAIGGAIASESFIALGVAGTAMTARELSRPGRPGEPSLRRPGDAPTEGTPTARPEPRRPAEPAAPAAPTAPVKNARTAELQKSLGDLERSVEVVENPARDDASVRAGFVDGKLTLKVGKHATAWHVGHHIETLRLLKKFEGPLGALNKLVSRIGSYLRLTPGFGTKGFEARAEIKKLGGMKADLERMLARADERAARLTSGPELALRAEDRAAMESELAQIKDQLARYEQELGSYAPGKGFIAADLAHDNATLAKRFGIPEADIARVLRAMESRHLAEGSVRDLLARRASPADNTTLTGLVHDIAAGGDRAAAAKDFLARAAGIHAADIHFDLTELYASYQQGDAVLVHGPLQVGQPLEDVIGGRYTLKGGRLGTGTAKGNLPKYLISENPTPAQQAANPRKAWVELPIDWVILEHNGTYRMVLGFEHSGLSGGRTSVFAAGELFVDKQGYVFALTDNSGHYRSSPENFRRALRLLYERGILDVRRKVDVRYTSGD